MIICESIEDKIDPIIKIKDCNKFRFNSDIYLPLNTEIEFRSLVININCIIEKNNEYYPEIYLDECLYVKDNKWHVNSLSERVKFLNGGIVFKQYKMNKVKELKTDNNLWAAPAKLVNLIDFEPKKMSIKTKNNANNNIKGHNIRYENGFYLTINNLRGYFNFNNNRGILTMLFDDINKQNKYYQVWKDIFKIINKGQGELKLHEKIMLYDTDLPKKQMFKIHSITAVIQSLIEKK